MRADERKQKQHHVNSWQPKRVVRTRHPDKYKKMESAPPAAVTALTVECDCDPKEVHADTTPYTLDDFNNDLDAPVAPTDDGLFVMGSGYGYLCTEALRYDVDHLPVSEPFAIAQTSGGGLVSIEESVGGSDFAHTNKPPGTTCGLAFTFLGWVKKEVWYKYTVPAHPPNMAGVMMSVGQIYDGKGSLPGIAGVKALVLGAQPTGMGQGDEVAVMYVGGSQQLFIPGAYIGAEGTELWIGFAPNWAMTTPGAPGAGPWYCGFDFPRDSDQGNSGDCGVPKSITAAGWYDYDPTYGTFGTGHDAEEDEAWFVGRLPWFIEDGGGTIEVDSGVLRYTPDAGGSQAVLSMPGLSEQPDTGDSEDGDDAGEPWTHEHGVRMLLRFGVSAVIDPATAGVRGLTMRWNDGSGWVSGTLHFGDPTNPSGMSVLIDDSTDVAAGEALVPGTLYCMWVDTRMEDWAVGRAWAEGDVTVPWSGESQRKVRAQRNPTYDGNEEANRFEVIIDAGDGQVIEIHDILVMGPGFDGQRVHEFLGSGDGSRLGFFTSQQFSINTVELKVAGFANRVTEQDRLQGKFNSVDALPAPVEARMEASYIVDRVADDGEDEPDTDDSADDPDVP